MIAAPRLQPVIMAGGSGTRLWPLSRADRPKQFMPLVGERALIADVAALVTGLPGADAPMIVTGEAYRFSTLAAFEQAGLAHGRVILEPMPRSTAGVAAIASLLVEETDPDGIVVLLAADHMIGDGAAFRDAVAHGVEAARAGFIVTFGVVPTRPATNYGYIRPGAPISSGGARRVASFVEKPDPEEAARYVADGYLWNSGNFVFRAAAMIEELGRHAPDILSACRESLAERSGEGDFVRLGKSYGDCRSQAIDYAVMEKTDRSVVLPLASSWSDLGAWGTLWEIGGKDAQGNVQRGSVVLENVRRSYVRAERGLVAALDVEDLVIVADEDVVLVAHRGRDQNVGRLVERLRAEGHRQADSSNRVDRPWGYYETLHSGDLHKVKHIVLEPGAAISLQLHHHRAEHWVVVHGQARVTIGDDVRDLAANQSVYVPQGTKHRLENLGPDPLSIIEVQTGAVLSEDDIVRFEDRYDRT